ncbi:MAG: hypothetical protein Q7S96_02195 [bacterium]|nr:hypothetical protein [bacterium]
MAELTVERFEQSMESFAKIVKEGFDTIDREFGLLRKEMHEEFQRVDHRIDKLSEHVDVFIQLHQKLDMRL